MSLQASGLVPSELSSDEEVPVLACCSMYIKYGLWMELMQVTRLAFRKSRSEEASLELQNA